VRLSALPSIGFLGAFLGAFCCFSLVRAGEAVQSISSTVCRLMESSRDAIVQVEARDDQGVIKGTGFFIDPMGTVMTLAAITEDAEEIVVRQQGQEQVAELLTSDPRSGISLLRAVGNGRFLTLAVPDRVAVADPVVLLGFPLEMDLSPGFGVVGGLDRKIGSYYFPTTHYRLNVPVLRGQGGSPVLNLEGQVVGIVTSSVDGGATCYALPSGAADKIRQDFVRFGEPRHGWVGALVEDQKTPVEGSKAVVCEVDPDGPGGKAGLQPGDVLLQVGRKAIQCREDILEASFFLTSGDAALIRVWRNGEVVELESQTTLHPSARKPTLHAGTDLMPRLQP
jgi:serine protease Do